MLAKRIIPCLDVKDGRLVKGERFVNFRDAGDPVKMAAHYDKEGADEIVLFDITASAEGRRLTLDVVRRAAEEVFVPFTVGGGVGSAKEMRMILAAGADKVSVNSAAVKNPDIIREGAERFGSQRIVLSVDCLRRSRPDGSLWWEVVIHGGRTPTGMDVLEWVQQGEELGAGEVVLNSIDADGTNEGYDNELNRTVAERVGIPVIASGGAGELSHLRDALVEGKADAALAASIFHFGRYRIAEAKEYLRREGIPVRL